MRILFFIDSLTSGGKERRLVELMKGIRLNARVQFELVIMSEEIHYKEILNMSIKIHYLIRSKKKDFSVFLDFYNICKKYKADIVHCWDSMTAVIAVPACKFLQIKLVNGLVVDTPVKRNILNKHWFRAQLTFPFSNVVIGNSLAGLAAYNAPHKKSYCIYNGMDFSRFSNFMEPSIVRKKIFGNGQNNVFVVGMVAAFEDRKDYKTLLKAAMILSSYHDSIRFILVGHGTNYDSIKESVPVSSLNKIIFLGKRSDVESIINIFDLGILLTNAEVHGEGISNSIIEYMALGKPVIATRGGGTFEVVKNGQNGYLINSKSEKELIDKIEILMENKNLKNEFGLKSRLIAEEKFDLKYMTDSYNDLYENLLN